MNDYHFGNFLYSLRVEKGLSQMQLGELLGVTNKAVSKWENGSAKPNTALLPRIAELLGVTVEELFACKRIEKDYETEKIKTHLSMQKRKYAVLSSAFLAAILTLPLLLIEFICVVMSFDIPDDVIGPLGSVGFIFAFIISVTAYVIYRKNFKQAITPTEIIHSPNFVRTIKRGIWVSVFTWWCILASILLTYLLILSFSPNAFAANIFLSVAVFVLIVLFGAFICFANIKRLLKIKASPAPAKRTPIRFADLPVWGKICYIASLVLAPVVLNAQIWKIFAGDNLFASIVFLAWLVVALPLIIYNIKKN